MKALCKFKRNGNPNQMVCIYCGIVAKGIEDYSEQIISHCQREAPPIEASMIEMANSAGGAVVSHMLGRNGTRDLDLQSMILRECSVCDRLSGGRCAECGCWLKLKVKSDGEVCPIMLWDRILIEHGTRDDVDTMYESWEVSCG